MKVTYTTTVRDVESPQEAADEAKRRATSCGFHPVSEPEVTILEVDMYDYDSAEATRKILYREYEVTFRD